VRAGFALRTHYQMRRAAEENLLRDDSAAREFKVVGVRAKSDQRQKVSLQFRCTLHLKVQWDRGLGK